MGRRKMPLLLLLLPWKSRRSIAGKANLEKSDLEPALKALKDRLMTKNVAEEIAEKLCES
ncbi:hypothetical protein GLYMA_02G204650v4 [Glycine max]|nr:hypothetical protein GLYMA_02G204650v4 [Glycine max]KAH1061301.1 hypothetical protein GYH30_004678 [Glycine max]